MKIEEQFNKVKPIILGYAKRYSKATNIPVEEYESALYEEFFVKTPRYNGSIAFTAFIKPILVQRAMRVADPLRGDRKFYDKVVHVDGLVDEDGTPEFEFADSLKVEEVAVENIEKTPDKLQLIKALTKNCDEITVAAVNLILTKPDASFTSIANELGIHHEILKRRLRRLARNYDAKVFGNLSQYLAV